MPLQVLIRRLGDSRVICFKITKKEAESSRQVLNPSVELKQIQHKI